MSYYAVKNGRIPGIYTTWGECLSQISGYKSASYKKFKTLEAAEQYLTPTVRQFTPDYYLWTDGSAYFEKSAGCAFLIANKNGDVIYEKSIRLTKPPFNSAYAEIIGVLTGLEHCKKYNFLPVEIKCDCDFIVKTINDWGPTRTESQWKQSEYFDLLYPLFLQFQTNPNIFISHTDAHVGNPYNERVDFLAKQAQV